MRHGEVGELDLCRQRADVDQVFRGCNLEG